MSTVVIGGGDEARKAVSDLENASVHMSSDERLAVEQVFRALCELRDAFTVIRVE